MQLFMDTSITSNRLFFAIFSKLKIWIVHLTMMFDRSKSGIEHVYINIYIYI